MAIPRLTPPQRGAYVVEFALILLIFLMLSYGILELARSMYMLNTLHEVARHAAYLATNTDFTDEGAKIAVRQKAIFRSSSGELALGTPITDAYIRIDYLSLPRAGDNSMTLTAIPNGSLPSCPEKNKIVCLNDPNDPSCIRFVRIRLCDPTDQDNCNNVQYKPLVSLVNLPINLPTISTIAPAETLGFTPGMATCP